MALPAALRMRREQIEQTNGTIDANGAVVDPTGAPVSEPAPAPTPEPPAAPAPPQAPSTSFDPAMFEVREEPTPVAAPVQPTPSEDFEQKYRTLQGINRSQLADNQALKEALQALTEQVAQLRTQPAPQAPVAPQAPSNVIQLPRVEVSAAQRANYSQAEPVIRAIAAELLQEAIGPIVSRMQSLEAELTQKMGDAQTTVAGVAKSTFQMSLAARVPDLEAVLATQDFQTFMNSLVPYTTETFRARLKRAFAAQDLETIAAVVNGYRAQKGPTPPPANPAAFSQPRTGGGASQQPQQPETGSKTMLAWSKRKEAGVQHIKKQISDAEFKQICDLYVQATLENRVDWQK